MVIKRGYVLGIIVLIILVAVFLVVGFDGFDFLGNVVYAEEEAGLGDICMGYGVDSSCSPCNGCYDEDGDGSGICKPLKIHLPWEPGGFDTRCFVEHMTAYCDGLGNCLNLYDCPPERPYFDPSDKECKCAPYSNINEGYYPCDDGNACTLGDYCSDEDDSKCISRKIQECDLYHDICIKEICNVLTGRCDAVPLSEQCVEDGCCNEYEEGVDYCEENYGIKDPDCLGDCEEVGAKCSDGNPCTINDVCIDGGESLVCEGACNC